MVIHRTHPYPAYGGPGAVTGGVPGRQGRRANEYPLEEDMEGKGVMKSAPAAFPNLFPG